MEQDIYISRKKCGNIFRNKGQYLYICYHCQAIYYSGQDIEYHIETQHFTNFEIGKADEFEIDFKVDKNYENSIIDELNIKLEPNLTVEGGDFKVEEYKHENVSQFANPCASINKILFTNQDETEDIGKIKKIVFAGETKLNDIVVNEQEILENGKKTYKCIVCNKLLYTKSGLKYHLRKIHSHYQCLQCAKNFSNEITLINHMNSDHKKISPKPQIYKCDICEKILKDNHSLKVHLNKHKNLRLFKCDICMASYNDKTGVAVHIKTTHRNIFYECDICGCKFKNRENQKKHMRNVHLNVSSFGCEYCGVTFPYKWSLIYHIRKHTGEKPYQCELCGLEFKTTSSISLHRKLKHTTTTYNCLICDKKFSVKFRLNKHMKTHSDERSYQCDICKNYFKSQKTLSNHKLIHGSEKKFQCQYCEQKFTQGSGRRSHVRSVHGVQ